MTHAQQNGFRIGPIAVDGRAVLAPMSGVTDVVFRRIARRFGASLVVSEMAASADLALGDTEARVRTEGQGIVPHVTQLAGCDPYWMAEAARCAEAAGADIIDINMGCPAKRVVGGLSGSALMRDPALAEQLMQAVVSAVSIPVTVKMRLGWDAASLNAPLLARRAQDIGIQAVTVHGRTRQQFYKGQADWRAIAAVVEAVDIPVIANGDIACIADAASCLHLSGAQAVMVGRAAMGQPWLIGQIAAALRGNTVPSPSAIARVEAIIEHYEGLLSLYGSAMGLRHARKHLAAFSDVFCEEFSGFDAWERLTLVTSDDPAVVTGLLRSLALRNSGEPVGEVVAREAAE